MCPLNPALDRVFRKGGSSPSLGNGSPEKIPLLVLVDLIWRTNAERGPWVSRGCQLQTFPRTLPPGSLLLPLWFKYLDFLGGTAPLSTGPGALRVRQPYLQGIRIMCGMGWGRWAPTGALLLTQPPACSSLRFLEAGLSILSSIPWATHTSFEAKLMSAQVSQTWALLLTTKFQYSSDTEKIKGRHF